MRTYRLVFASLLVAAAMHTGAARAQDDDDEDSDERDSICTASLDRGRVNGTLNVVGPCRLDRTEVRGDVILFAGGSLVARGARIRGTLDGDRADFVDLDDVRIDGNVTLQDLVGDSSTIESSEIRGNLVLTGNRSRFEIVDNELRRDLTASGNTGGLEIAGYEMLKGLDGVHTHEHREWIPILENDQDMTRLAAVAGQALDAHPRAHAFLLRRHGLYTWGRTIADAERHVEILEFLFEAIARR